MGKKTSLVVAVMVVVVVLVCAPMARGQLDLQKLVSEAEQEANKAGINQASIQRAENSAEAKKVLGDPQAQKAINEAKGAIDGRDPQFNEWVKRNMANNGNHAQAQPHPHGGGRPQH